MTAPQELKTARLLLRSLEQADIPAIARLAGAREIASMTANIPHPYAEQDARNFLARASEEFRSGLSVSFAICVSATRELCGGVGLNITPAHQRAELGYWIGVPFWGNGYATEAARAAVAFGFQTLALHRIYAFHFAGNAASGRVLEKIGMRHEGRSREHVKKWDRFVDLENYGLLESEFSEKK
ncbi:MAG: GNAT family N-acetyltransferase [Acidobacteriia bacterium]|nr:GNAT family N-acetyltransferase [Terriglobia bacterium]